MSGQVEDKPLSSEEFANLVSGFAPLPKKVALAVSGGADSMALAFCFKRWAQVDCVALVVEHGLRPESATEAQEVSARLRSMGFEVSVLPWRHDPISARVEDTARSARYSLLLNECKRLEISDLFIAHHMDDQAETVIMRLSKGSGIDGLAGMPEQSVRDGIRLLRPFLSVPKKRLIATCVEAGVHYVIDPTNASEKYARGRLRSISSLLAAEGMTPETIYLLSKRAGEAKDALDFYVKQFLSLHARIEYGGVVLLDREELLQLPRAVALKCLAMCMQNVNGERYPPEYSSLSVLLDTICCGSRYLEENKWDARLRGHDEKTSTGNNSIHTLGGCILSISEGRVRIMREPSLAAEIIKIEADTEILWDGRWKVSCGKKYQGMTLKSLGNPPHEELDIISFDLRRKVPQGRARASLPAIWDKEKLVAIPCLNDGKTKAGDDYVTASLLRPILT